MKNVLMLLSLTILAACSAPLKTSNSNQAGEQVNYRRLGSCCPIKTPNGYNGGGLLDMYEVTYKGLKKSKILFFNMYDSSKTKIPHGFKAIN